MWSVKKNSLNPNPITKFFVVGLLGLTVVHSIHPVLEWMVIFVISIMYLMNGLKKEALKNVIIFGVLFLAPNFKILAQLPFFIKMFFSLIFVLRMFYIPYAAGKFLIKTSDVGSIISSMDVLKIPSAISIPVAVMFRFFPSFVEEKNHIKMAMKIRGIETKNPLKYLEYVAVPLLIISSNIADDISKAAETKCIANPIKKTRYIRVGVGVIDFIYAMTMTIIVIGGWLCLK
ncbi:TPA: energy-coupling factor transporter transmembrane component T [Streptococcus agalactiae]|uniref:Energy-coupling factor transporter transmembrane component T n=3 Tax=Streptococcus TaxID=1301 RepID=A0AB38XZE7_STREQ|nr:MULTISPECIES: energy-coupling factor transporter transmembrane component T [Streptococcus]NSQ38205.1 energy-coupling factor transporter transmembrane protein EcfT [Enterococcus faecalis]HES3528387.1 energy-coupling factor transporter transmembrane protein EcfT [Streptococcus pyogenes]AIK71232.1 ABC transporter permease [Streptococcus agalactiae]AIK73357.1 ABC transporter permease [Streptococcus agalactiae]AIK75400.1 ABC transporter permease [Streptococcus agalactiae]